MRPYTHIILIILAPLILLGCGVHYYDKKSGTEHLWGVGHMKMKITAPSEGLQSVVHGIDIAGFTLGKGYKQYYLTLGWNRLQYIDVLKENTSIRLEWPENSFFNVRVGSEFPLDTPPYLKPIPNTKNNTTDGD